MEILATVTRGQETRQITAGDALWLARMCDGEAGSDALEAHACAVVLVRRWMTRSTRLSLTDFARAFSQPINPRWSRGGDLVGAEIARADAQGRAVIEQQLMRRAQISARPWSDCSQAARDAVAKTCAGELVLPFACDWGAPSLYRSHGLSTGSMQQRLQTAYQAVISRETARGRRSPRYEHLAGSSVTGNVFSSDATSQGAEIAIRGTGALPSGGADSNRWPALLALALVVIL